jgi:hypothetical protein
VSAVKAPVAALVLAAVSVFASQPARADGFTPELFEIFVESNMGLDGAPVYYYSTGTVREFPGGRLLATIEGVDMARLLHRDEDGTVHKAARKMFILRDIESGEVIETIGGRPNTRYFYPYQYMQFRLDGDRLVGTSTQGSGDTVRTVDIGANFTARMAGETAVFSAPNFRGLPDGTGSFEMYEFWVPRVPGGANPHTTLTLTLVNWNPIGEGRPVYTHRTSWRVDAFEELPASLRHYIERRAPMYREPPRDLSEIDRLQRAAD